MVLPAIAVTVDHDDSHSQQYIHCIVFTVSRNSARRGPQAQGSRRGLCFVMSPLHTYRDGKCGAVDGNTVNR